MRIAPVVRRAGAWVTPCPLARQAYFGRTVTSTRNCAGTMSRRSARSSPIFTISPQPQGQNVLSGLGSRMTRYDAYPAGDSRSRHRRGRGLLVLDAGFGSTAADHVAGGARSLRPQPFCRARGRPCRRKRRIGARQLAEYRDGEIGIQFRYRARFGASRARRLAGSDNQRGQGERAPRAAGMGRLRQLPSMLLNTDNDVKLPLRRKYVTD